MTTAIIIYQPEPDLFALLRGPWTITTTYHKSESLGTATRTPKSYTLRHRGIRQRVIPAHPQHAFITPELGRMIRECCHLNRIGAEPRPRIQCAADAPNPGGYLDSIKYVTPIHQSQP